MNKLFALALRNLMRNRRRSLATLLAMMLGIVTILLFGGFVYTIKYGLQTAYVRTSGHVQIQHRDYFLYGSGNPAAFGIPNYQRIMALVEHDPVLAPMLTVVTPVLQLGGVAGNFAKDASRTVQVVGLDVAKQDRMLDWNDFHISYHPPALALTGTPVDSAIVGTGVARVLQLCGELKVANCSLPQAAPTASGAVALPADVASLATEQGAANDSSGAHIELLAATARGAPNVAALHVIKAENAGFKELDDVYVMLHLQQAQRLVYGAEPPQATAIAVQLHHSTQIAAARARLEQLLARNFPGQPLVIQEFTTLNPSYGQTMALFGTIFGFMALLIGAIVLFTVSNTMSMAVVERTVEIGTLRALGLRRSGIRRLFLIEGVLLGVIGAAVGALLALTIAAAINHGGLLWTPPGQVKPVPFVVHVFGEWGMIAGSSMALMAITALSAWWPARRAARLNIVEALRHA